MLMMGTLTQVRPAAPQVTGSDTGHTPYLWKGHFILQLRLEFSQCSEALSSPLRSVERPGTFVSVSHDKMLSCMPFFDKFRKSPVGLSTATAAHPESCLFYSGWCVPLVYSAEN